MWCTPPSLRIPGLSPTSWICAHPSEPFLPFFFSSLSFLFVTLHCVVVGVRYSHSLLISHLSCYSECNMCFPFTFCWCFFSLHLISLRLDVRTLRNKSYLPAHYAESFQLIRNRCFFFLFLSMGLAQKMRKRRSSGQLRHFPTFLCFHFVIELPEKNGIILVFHCVISKNVRRVDTCFKRPRPPPCNCFEINIDRLTR